MSAGWAIRFAAETAMRLPFQHLSSSTYPKNIPSCAGLFLAARKAADATGSEKERPTRRRNRAHRLGPHPSVSHHRLAFRRHLLLWQVVLVLRSIGHSRSFGRREPTLVMVLERPDHDVSRILDRVQRDPEVPDLEFDAIYPEWVRRLSEHHWTPLSVCVRAAELLGSHDGATILDVGSGAGKFCLIGGARSAARFVGVEQRPRLVDVSRRIARRAGLRNVEFIHGNVMSLDWGRFDGFYLFNPFYEHVIDYQPRIDEPIVVSPHLFTNYVVTTCVKL